MQPRAPGRQVVARPRVGAPSCERMPSCRCVSPAQVIDLLQRHGGGGAGGWRGYSDVLTTLAIVSAVAMAAIGSGIGLWERFAAALLAPVAAA